MTNNAKNMCTYFILLDELEDSISKILYPIKNFKKQSRLKTDSIFVKIDGAKTEEHINKPITMSSNSKIK